MNNYLALTVISDDRPGIVEKIADVVRTNGGNWLESSMSRLAGKFAGLLLIEINEHQQQQLIDELHKLKSSGLRISVEPSAAFERATGQLVSMNVVGNDRPGIVGEISTLLAKLHVNVEELTTSCEEAPMSAEVLFRADAKIHLPENLSLGDLQSALETLSDDLIVELECNI
ncbi:MAG: ACT domain-containing protein [Porticoccaceae bacterium]|nr:glycine cleavage system protein R [Pseudomonadales bacterium]MCP5171830.1 glycine cleavage system protein R [Pseudomonadales bacterium]